MIQLAYRSTSIVDDGSSTFFITLAEIFEKSLINNAKRKITGVLAFNSGRFVQILEGAASDVDPMLATITTDRRHSGIHIMSRQSVGARSFGAWSMAFVGGGTSAGTIMNLLAECDPSSDAYRTAIGGLAKCIG
ncbi:BLUF domain-containing protein [Polymorphobacter sp. PAMC 29334]|uniref:BLUF domain-containing protein n=1 Tax=Polymorphobacter sp. PAMC 29334 TaxID=2862331 RepID=UPI001C66A63E|nr:BLUF domain-containing protein [Polymorphobacter sp. PAMC 29334]QYE36120.1 BLUF domain-containing protein [Polymorphobacter sp. PAMC 29334]